MDAARCSNVNYNEIMVFASGKELQDIVLD